MQQHNDNPLLDAEFHRHHL